MAKQARESVAAIDVTEKRAKKFRADIFERLGNIESARGSYMNKARREREAMTAIYEGITAFGISQKAAKTEIKIIQLMERIRGLVAELEADQRKQVEKLAKALDDKKQLSLMLDVPKPKPEKVERVKAEPPPKSDLESTQPIGVA